MEQRMKKFERNEALEVLLKDINQNLRCSEEQVLRQANSKKYPIVFVMGALRSGTTLLTQWLANTEQFAYPTNFLSRFYEAPVIGAKIQNLLLNPRYNFRNELSDISCSVDYNSENGKTQGALAPNEFWYFWRRFFPYDSKAIDYIPDKELKKIVDCDIFVRELEGVADVFEKPLVLKGMIANYNIAFLNEIIDNAIFIYIKRDLGNTIDSVLEARKRQLGDEKKWYSFHIPEMNLLQKYDNPATQVAGQVYYIHQAIERELVHLPEERKVLISYEDFCENPQKYYCELQQKLYKQGYDIEKEYRGKTRFDITRKKTSDKAQKGLDEFMKDISSK